MKYKKVLVIMSVLAMLAGVMGCKEKEALKEEPVKQETVQKQEKPEEHEYSCAMKSHFRKFGNQMSGSGNHLCKYTSLLA